MLGEVWPLLTILGAILITLGRPLWDGRQILSLDNLTFYMPFYEVMGDRLRHGDIPGWNPHILGGASFAGDPQSGWMYVPAMLLFAIFPAGVAMKAFVLLHLFGAGASAYALARVLGQPRLAATVAGAAFVFSPLVEFAQCCAIRIQLAVWLPLAFLGLELAVRERSWPGRIAWCSLTGFTLSQMAAGWPGQGTYYGALAIGSYGIFRTLLQPPAGLGAVRRRLATCLVIGGAVVVIGGGLAAAGLLPRLDSLRQTNLRGGDYAEEPYPNQTGVEADTGGWQWEVMLARVLIPRDDSRFTLWYAGAGTLALAVVAPFLAGRRFGVPYFLIYSIVVATLATATTWLHRLFYLLPEFQTFHEHVPNRVLAVLPIGPAMLAGATIAALQRRLIPTWLIAVAGAVPIALLAIAKPIVEDPRRSITGETWGTAATVGTVVIVFALLMVLERRRRVPGGMPQLVLALPLVAIVLDPVGFTRLGMLPHRETSATDARQLVEVFSGDGGASGAASFLRERLAADGPFRYVGYDPRFFMRLSDDSYRVQYEDADLWAILEANLALPNHLYDGQGYNPVQYERYIDYVLAMNGAPQEYHETNVQIAGLSSPLLDLLNVRYVVVPAGLEPDSPGLAPIASSWPVVYEDSASRIFENPDVLPRAWIVHEARTLPRESAVSLLEYDQVDPRRTALLEKDPPVLAPSGDPAADLATVNHFEADRLRVETTTDAAGLLVLSEVYDAGWRAYVDGKRVDVYAADGLFRAVPVPAGRHAVELRYEPTSLRVGLAITALTSVFVAVLIAFVVIDRLKPRRPTRLAAV